MCQNQVKWWCNVFFSITNKVKPLTYIVCEFVNTHIYQIDFG